MCARSTKSSTFVLSSPAVQGRLFTNGFKALICFIEGFIQKGCQQPTPLSLCRSELGFKPVAQIHQFTHLRQCGPAH